MIRPLRGIILPTVLFVLLLLGVLGAMFAFRVNADLASTQAAAFRFQTRLAAQAGLAWVKLILPSARQEMDRWYHNPDEMHRILVWAHDTDPILWGTDEELEEGTMAYRFSVVADDPTDDLDYVRFGVTDEASKLNLNTATETQLLTLVRAAAEGDEEIDPQEIVDAIQDWRDRDNRPRGKAGDTEGPYYRTLEHPYHVANAPFETVEELLLVKGVTGKILYGEDFDRNGLLTPNEDDGNATFPPDNEDGLLNRGLYPYLTVASYEDNVSHDHRPRIYLHGDAVEVRTQLLEVFEDDPDAVDYIMTALRGQGGNESGQGNNNNPANQGDQQESDSASEQSEDTGENDKSASRQQVKESPGASEDEDTNETNDQSGADEGSTPPGNQGGSQGDPKAGPIRTPVSLLLPRSVRGEIRESPLDAEHLAVLLDRTTTLPPEQRKIQGLININTAPALVLGTIDGLNDEQISSIVSTRESLPDDEKSTPAWLVAEEVLDLSTLERIAPAITTRGQQFTIEVLGYADHIGMVSRVQAIVDLVGPIAQTIYYRDLTHLGGHYPIRQEDKENVRVR